MDSTFVTKKQFEDLKRKLKPLVEAKWDLEKLRAELLAKLVSKEDFSELSAHFMSFFAHQDHVRRMGDLLKEMDDRNKTLDEKISARFDALMFELKAMREEMTIMNYRESDHSDQLENHEHRLEKLETSLQPA